MTATEKTTWNAWSQLGKDGRVDVEGETMADAAMAYAEASKGRGLGMGRIAPTTWKSIEDVFFVNASGAVFDGDKQIL